MTDGVARELEQAEARLARSKDQFWKYWLGADDRPNSEDSATLDDLLSITIEVGRLRALAEVAPLVGAAAQGAQLAENVAAHIDDLGGSGGDTVRSISDILRAALAVREEVRG